MNDLSSIVFWIPSSFLNALWECFAVGKYFDGEILNTYDDSALYSLIEAADEYIE